MYVLIVSSPLQSQDASHESTFMHMAKSEYRRNSYWFMRTVCVLWFSFDTLWICLFRLEQRCWCIDVESRAWNKLCADLLWFNFHECLTLFAALIYFLISFWNYLELFYYKSELSLSLSVFGDNYRRVLPTVQPGYLRPLIPDAAPTQPENWQDVMADIERVIMPGITHWHSPQFHAYFPTANSYPAIVADMLSGAIACIGFSWVNIMRQLNRLQVEKLILLQYLIAFNSFRTPDR